MNRLKNPSKIIVITLIMLLTISTIAVFTIKPASATEIIQDWIDEAENGDTIYVPADTYSENIVVDKSITLIAEDPDPANTKIIGNGDGYTITVTANEVIISGFTVANSGSAIFLNAVNKVQITNNIIEDSSGQGIMVLQGSNNLISGNEITGISGDGIVVQGQSAFLTIKTNNIHDNIIANGAIIIEDGSSNNDVVDNIIEDNTGNDVGVIINDATALYNRITSNMINTDDVGIYLNHAAYAMVRGNSITTTSQGVSGLSCQHIGIIENTIQAKTATIFEKSSCISIVQNTLSQDSLTSGSKAVYLDQCENSWVTDNDISVFSIGVFIFGPINNPAKNHVNGNDLYGNVQAVVLDNTDENVIQANSFTANTASDGVLSLIFASTYNIITENNFVGNNFVVNTLDAFVSDDSTENNFDGNYWDEHVSTSPYIINEDPLVVDNYPLDSLWVYQPVYNMISDDYYPSIQEAIDSDRTSAGDIIQVANGVYHENVDVSMSLQLIGASSEGTLIDGNHDGVCIGTASGTIGIVIENFAITNGGAEGIFLQGTQDAVVSNNFVYSNDASGLFQTNGLGNTISENRFVNNYQSGVDISGSIFTTLTNNYIEYNHVNGIFLIAVIDSTVQSNIITHNIFDGLGTDYDCTDLVITSNTVTDNWVNGFGLAHTTDTQVTMNDAFDNGQDGYALFECSTVELVDNTAQGNKAIGIYLSSTQDITVRSNSISQSEQGIQLDDSSGNNIAENTISNNNNIGALLQASQTQNTAQNIFTSNTITTNGGDGLQLNNADNNQITYNTIQSNGAEGIRLIVDSTENLVAYNTVSDSGGDGIGIETQSNQNDIINNYITNSGFIGIHPHGGPETADHITDLNIIGNTMQDNSIGIILTNAWKCQIYHNNFITNPDGQAITSENSADNVWDNGYPSGGNYWSNYKDEFEGKDLFYGSLQDELGSDGIGDSAYRINADNADNYPLFNFFNPVEMPALDIEGDSITITITSNATLTSATSTPGTLSFTVNGPTGETGYLRAIVPIDAVNTDMQLSVDGKQPSSVTIEQDDTHYYVYAEFTFSSHEIMLLFAVPEYALGGLAAVGVCFVAFALFKKRNNLPHF